MTTPQSQERFRAWLTEQIEMATGEVTIAQEKNPDTFAHGVRSGELTALLDVREYFTGER